MTSRSAAAASSARRSRWRWRSSASTSSLIEAHPFGTFGQPSFDDRTTALSNGSRRIFEALRVWPLLEREATAIRRIHVSDRGRFGFARLDAAEQGLSALGFVVVNRAMGAALWRRLEAELGADPGAGAGCAACSSVDGRQRIECDLGPQGSASVEAKLAIAADGAQSVLREAAGIGAQTWNYEQTALVTNVLTQRFHDHVAYERFTPSGPLALLPMSEGRLGLIWTFATDVAPIDRAGGRRRVPRAAAGRVRIPARALHAGRRAAAVSAGADARGRARGRAPRDRRQCRADAASDRRPGLQSRSARRCQPRGGARRRTRAAAATRSIRATACGCERYREWRVADRSNIVRFTDGLVRLFAQPLGPIKALRDVGMLAFDLMPAAKGALSQLSLGAAGRIPKLARGASLL